MEFILGGGLLVSVYLIANYVYFPMINNKPIVGFRFEDDDSEYECKYIEDYDKLELKELDEIEVGALATRSLIEETPNGEVLLFYNSRLSHFTYYSKKKDIAYKYLETVSRKFVCDNDCKSIYVDYLDEILKAKVLVEKKAEEEEFLLMELDAKMQEENKHSVFAYLKTYVKTADVLKNVVIPEKCNKYIYKGSIEDYYRDKKILDAKKLLDAEKLLDDEKLLVAGEKIVSSSNISFAAFRSMLKKNV